MTDEKPLAEETVARAQGLRLATMAIETLDFDKRAVFVPHEIDGLAMPDIAEALGIPLNTAYSRLRLARRDFNQAVASQKTRMELEDEKP